MNCCLFMETNPRNNRNLIIMTIIFLETNLPNSN